MKKILSALMCVAMLLSLSTAVSADFRFSPDRVTTEAVVETDENGVEYFGTITGGDTEIKLTVNEIVLTNNSGDSTIDRENLDQESKEILAQADEKMENVREQLTEAASVFEVFGTETLSAEKTYAVSAMFDITPVGDGIDTVERCFEELGYLEVTVRIDVPADGEYYFATLCEDEWVFLSQEQVTDNKDGTVTLRFYELCPVVLIEAADASDDVVQSPQTSSPFPIFEVMAAVFALSAGVCFVLFAKKRSRA